MRLRDHETLAELEIAPDDVIDVHVEQIGAGRGDGPGKTRMGLGIGGFLPQTIEEDKYPASTWNEPATSFIDIGMLRPMSYALKTKMPIPAMPITASAYHEYGLPYYKQLDRQLSGVQGDFHGMKTARELDGTGDASFQKIKAFEEVAKNYPSPVVLLNRYGKRLVFVRRLVLRRVMMRLLQLRIRLWRGSKARIIDY